jgi:quinol monooxygenase YgiN
MFRHERDDVLTLDADATRRDVLRTLGGGSLALLALAGMKGEVFAQEATPATAASLAGAYAVVRVRRVRPEFSATALAQEVGRGFVPIVRKVPGFLHYFVVADEEQRSWVSVGVFTDKAGADESTERAAAFGQQGTHDWVEGDPIIIAGTIDTAAP